MGQGRMVKIGKNVEKGKWKGKRGKGKGNIGSKSSLYPFPPFFHQLSFSVQILHLYNLLSTFIPHLLSPPLAIYFFSFYFKQIVFSGVFSKYSNSFHNFSFLPLLTQTKAIFCTRQCIVCLSPLGLLDYRCCLDPVFKTHMFQHGGILWFCITVISGVMIGGTLLCAYVSKDSMYVD